MPAWFDTRRTEPLSLFTGELFGQLPRSDQRRRAHAYLHGLLAAPGKKTVRNLAATPTDTPTTPHALHQFINESPWDWTPVRRRLAHWTKDRAPLHAWVLAPVVLPKRGAHSCGVERRFVPDLGRVVNCQVGLGMFLSTGTEEVPLDWNLLLTERWTLDPLRHRARIPETATGTPPAQAMELIRSAQAAGATGVRAAGAADMRVAGVTGAKAAGATGMKAPVVADLTGYVDVTGLVAGLTAGAYDFAVAVPDDFPLLPHTHALPRPRTPGNGTAVAARTLVPRVRPGARNPLARTAHRSPLVRMPHDSVGAGARQHCRLFREENPGGPGHGRLWLTNLVQHPMPELLTLVGRQTGAMETVQVLKDHFGLGDFEGRSFPGWHHYMTVVSAAYAHHRLASRPAPVPTPEPDLAREPQAA